MRLAFYKVRAIILLYTVKILAKVLFLETPPLFSVTGLISRGDTLLFLDLAYSKGLGLPGGIVKGGETLEESLRREIFEETGLSVTHFKYFTSTAAVYHGFPTMSAVFLVETAGNLKNSDEGKLLWMHPKDAIGKLFYRDAEETIQKFIEVQDRKG